MASGTSSTDKADRGVGRPSLRPRLKASIRELIEEDGLGPGDRLASEKQLCERFGVSRPSIRGALGELAREGKIVSLPGKGHYLTGSARPKVRAGVIVCLLGSYHANAIWNSPYLAGIVTGLQEVTAPRRRRVLIETLGPEDRPLDTVVAPHLSDLAGLVLVPLSTQSGELMVAKTPDVPKVVLGRAVAPDLAPSVWVDLRTATTRAAETLLNMGHRGVAMVDHAESGWPGQQRQAGYRDAFASGHLPIDESLILAHLPQELPVIRQALQSLIARKDVTALMLTTLPGVLRDALELADRAGRRVPEDLSIIAMDESPETRQLCPAISVVRQPLPELGRVGGQMLIGMLEGRTPNPAAVTLPAELVIRGSTGACPRETQP